jgi:hypothetical protein
MAMHRWLVLSGCLVMSAGCNRQDVDGLGRIGRKLLDRSQVAVSPLREQFDHTLIGAAGIKGRVQQRLQNDKSLTDARLEVVVNQAEVELKGTLKRDEQRRRAVELAESTVGVERVTDHLQLE